MRVHRGTKWIGVILLTLGVMGLNLLISAPARAQVTGASVSGTLSDASGAVIPNGKLVIKDVATGVSTTVASNADGFYTAQNLIPGNYEITITAPGFGTEVRSGIVLEVGAQVVQNIALKVGQVTQNVKVTDEASAVQLVSSSISATVSNFDVVELPLNGRSWTDLADLQAGTAQLTTQGHFDAANDATSRGVKGYGIESSIDGARPTANNFRLDGISVNDYANGAPANVGGEVAGVDAIQEFSVVTANFSAEYGMTTGGVINAVTRSGKDELHGSAYEFLRNNVLDARNYFDGPQIPPLRRNQFGASLGGPIRKNRAFFFANYEGLRQFQGLTVINEVPSAAARTGIICSEPSLAAASSPCTTTTVTVDPSAAAYLPLYPLPNAGLLPTGDGDIGYFDLVDPQVLSDDYGTARIDDVISEKDHVDGTFSIGKSPFTFPDNFDENVLGFFANRQTYSIEETHVFNANLVNTARVGVFRETEAGGLFIRTNNPLMTDMSLGSQPGYDASGVRISGVTGFEGGANGFFKTSNAFTTPQFYDDASWVHGTHTVKFGFAVERQDANTTAYPSAGTFAFGSLTDFLTNVPTSYQAASVEVVPPERGWRATVLGGYVQDDWHLRPYLTVNMGFRYETMTNMTEAHGYLASLTSLTSTSPRVGNPLYESNPTLHNFEPRVGFAWDPFHNGKTSVRGAFGLADMLPLPYEWQADELEVVPFELQYNANSLAAGSFYSGVTPYLTPTTATAVYVDQKPPLTYLMQRNLSVQRELTPNLTVTVSYIGSHGVHLPLLMQDADMVIPTVTSAGLLFPNPIGSGTKINPSYGKILSYTYNSGSEYNAMQVQVVKRMSHGVDIGSSFTWGKSLDNSSQSASGNDYTNAISNPFSFYPKSSWGPSDFNVGRTLVINGIWQIPEAKSLPRVVSRVVNGWQMGVIYIVSDGMPFTPTFGTGGNVAGFNNQSGSQNDYPDRLTSPPGCAKAVHPQDAADYVNLNCFTLPEAPNSDFWTANCDQTSKVYGSPATTEPYPICLNLMGNAGRNSLVGPGQESFDFSMVKNNKIGKKFNAQFRAEFFNILNRANFSPPNLMGGAGDLFNADGTLDGGAGVLTSTSTSSRQIQLALKLIW